MLFGAELRAGGGVRFRLFAPGAAFVRLRLDGEDLLPLHSFGDGWHEVTTNKARTGSRYQFVLPDDTCVPDPASRHQPDDVDAASEVIDPHAYPWQDAAWCGRPWVETVLYELHAGTFTAEGTFRAAMERLDHLQCIGITAIELMCLADFPGGRNWGYDSVLMYAPDSGYGRPEQLKEFIDAAHARGIQVILDVVYNHFGPQGNYLPRYFPQLLTSEHRTPWGDALNFDDAKGGKDAKQVREFIIHNALYWIEEFHVDGLRLDAAHAMIDSSRLHVLDELALRVQDFAQSCSPKRHIHLIREEEHNISDKLLRNRMGECERYTAQWNHDMSHLLGAAMRTNFEGGADDEETRKQAQAVAEGFVIAAEESGEGGAVRCKVPPTAFVSFVQTHDLIGNRIAAERIYALAPKICVRAVMSVLLLAPQIPMLFMGDEFASSSPFPYFSDFGGDLGETVRKGRCEFLKRLHNANDADLKVAPNPQAPETFLSAKLDWEEAQQPDHAEWAAWYGSILRVRLQRLAPLLHKLKERCGTFRILHGGAFEADWKLDGDSTLHLAVNLRPGAMQGFTAQAGEVLWTEGSAQSDTELGAWSVRWKLEAGRQD